MNKRLKTIGIFALVIAVAIIVVLLPKDKETSKSETDVPSQSTSTIEIPESVPQTSFKVVTEEERIARREAFQEKMLEEASQNIVKLQSLLDDNERHDEALELALKMSKGNRAERAASLDTFLWVGGPKSVKALLELRNDTGAIRERVNDILQHLLQQELQVSNSEDKSDSDGDLFELDDWFQLIDSNENVDEANAYLMLLTSFDIETAAPVLIKLLETDNPDNQARAREYLEFISNGLSLNTPEQAREWLEKYKRGEATSFKEKEDTAASSDDIGTDAGTGTATATEGQ